MFGNTSEMLKEIETLSKKNSELEAELKDLRKEFKRFEADMEREKAVLLKAMELEFKEKLISDTAKIKDQYNNKVIEDMGANFEKLKTSLTKIHEEGNANTRYLENVTLKMMDAMNVNITNKRVAHADDTKV